MPSFRQLQRFIAVATELNFRRAAAQLHISQPPLSDSIRQLEEEIGAVLFLRTRRRVELTKAGEVLLERAQIIVSQMEEATKVTRAVADGLSGQIAIGFFPTATYDLLPRILRRYREEYPDIAIQLIELMTPEQPSALEQKRIDVGLFLAPTVDRPGIAQETLLTEPLYAALPESHRLARRTQIKLQELRSEAFIFIPPRWGTGYHAQVSHACLEAGFTPKIVKEVEQIHTMVSLVGANMGIALVADSIRRFQPPHVVFRPIQDPSKLLFIEFGLAWREDNLSPAIDAFCRIARTTAKDMAF
jgi:DNA-binding transcriptional LysR family regulator